MKLINKITKLLSEPNVLINKLGYKIKSLLGSNNYKHFIILSRSRTGSNFLVSLLNSHPHIHTRGEAFNRLAGQKYQTVLKKEFSKQPNYIKAKGFKIFYYHPLDEESCGIWDELQSMKNLHVIHLTRGNILEILLSRKIADIQDEWLIKSDSNSSDSLTKPVSVSFTVDELTQGFEQTKGWEKEGNEMFKSHKLLPVTYEELITDKNETFKKLSHFLNVGYQSPQTNLKKQNIKTFKERINNYQELKLAFIDTQWSEYFTE
ncbi:sulfotransferase domain-containing protein [bacterium]|nr:sulfotransferase domain-containing protein [bacterium]